MNQPIDFINIGFSPIESTNNSQRILNPNLTKKIKIHGKRIIKLNFDTNVKISRIRETK
jgi:hypothetical protein